MSEEKEIAYKNGMSFGEEQQLYWNNEKTKRELQYMITPSELDIKKLYDYLIYNVSFDKVLSLYILLRNAISTGNIGDE